MSRTSFFAVLILLVNLFLALQLPSALVQARYGHYNHSAAADGLLRSGGWAERGKKTPLSGNSPPISAGAAQVAMSNVSSSAVGSCYFMAPVLWHWDGPFSIGVSIPDGPAWARRIISQALQHWNNEQTLFEELFHIMGNRYTFFESNSNTGPVQISYDLTSSSFLALTTPLNSTKNGVNSANVAFNTNLIQVPDNHTSEIRLYRIALHELGHILGLGDIRYRQGDIMNGWAQRLLNLTQRVDITTLDLYVINLLSTVTGTLTFPWFICKPSNIPYTIITPGQ